VGPAAADRQLQDRAYFLDLLGDSHNGLGRRDAVIEAYRQARLLGEGRVGQPASAGGHPAPAGPVPWRADPATGGQRVDS
jgi:hypothetical protein